MERVVGRGVFVTPIEIASVAMWDHMLEGWPDEVCGLVWDDGTITRLRNQAASPTRFTVGRTQLAEALAAVSPDDKLLCAVYHSHPNGSGFLSVEDRDSMKTMWEVISVPWVIVGREINDAIAFDFLSTWTMDAEWYRHKGTFWRNTELADAV